MDWTEACRLLGVSESATEAEIKEQYLYKAQLLHPDKNLDKPENVRSKAEAEFALINQAYAFISNPQNNPYRVPPKLAVDPPGIRFVNVKPAEKKSTTLTVSNIGGPYTGIWIDNQPAAWLSITGVKSLSAEQLPLEVTLECVGSGEAGSKLECTLLIKLENDKTGVVDQGLVKVEMVAAEASILTNGNTNNKTVRQIENPTTAVPPPATKSKTRTGLGLAAFLVNFLALAILGIVVLFILQVFTELPTQYLIIGLIVYMAISFGVAFNHALKIGSLPPRSNSKKP